MEETSNISMVITNITKATLTRIGKAIPMQVLCGEVTDTNYIHYKLEGKIIEHGFSERADRIGS